MSATDSVEEAMLHARTIQALDNLRAAWRAEDSIELTKVNRILNHHGFAFPVGARGVSDALNLAEARQQAAESRADIYLHALSAIANMCHPSQLPIWADILAAALLEEITKAKEEAAKE